MVAVSYFGPVRRSYENVRIATSREPRLSREQRMQEFVDAAWDALSHTGVSWVGFYLLSDEENLTLGPRRDKPACSPIGLHGACGRAARSGRPLIVRDVAALGAGYIACDPRDRSELVLPLTEPGGRVWGVLDVDSYDLGAFDAQDALDMQRLLTCAGLTAARLAAPDCEIIG